MKLRNNGFSLIELMVVIAIVAVLAAIAMPAYKNYTIRSRIAGVANLLSTLTYPAIVYRNKYGAWPAPDTNPTLSTKPPTDLVASWVHANNAGGGNRPYIIANLVNNTSLLGAASGGYLAYVCTESNDVVKCRCRTAPPGEGLVVIPTELLPADCQCNEGWTGCAP